LDRDEVEEALGDKAWEGKHYRVGYRDIAASTNERTLISTIIPKCYHGNKIPTVTPANDSDEYQGPNDSESLWLTSVLCSFVVDFLIRQKISTTLNFFYVYSLPVPRVFEGPTQVSILQAVKARTTRVICVSDEFSDLWKTIFETPWQSPDFWYPPSAPIDTYGPVHEQEIRRRLRNEAKNLTPEWGPHCGVHDRLLDRRDTGDRAQLRAEIDAYVAHLYGLSGDDFAYILDTFPVLKKKEKKAFGEFTSKRKCLEEYDRIKKIIMNYE